MKILITGADGMVARAAANYYNGVGDKVCALNRRELDISDKKAVFAIFEREKFDAVINCAAYTNVDGAETDKDACFRANVFGVENLALAAKKIDAAFLTISTDYVFDGLKNEFYTQRDTPNPSGVYAKSKLEGEIRARDAYARSIVVRAGWIFGSEGRNFLSRVSGLLAEGKQIKVISDAFGTPTFAEDLVRRLRELIELDLPCVYHVANDGKGASHAEFALKVCEMKNFDCGLIEKVSANDLNRPAPRPRSTKLRCLFSEKLGLSPLRDWEKALEDFLSKND